VGERSFFWHIKKFVAVAHLGRVDQLQQMMLKFVQTLAKLHFTARILDRFRLNLSNPLSTSQSSTGMELRLSECRTQAKKMG